jgi:hypothetical protein
VTKTHVSGQVSDAGTVLEDLGGHAVALALVEATTGAAAHNTGGILTTVLEEIQSIVDLDGCCRRFRVSVNNGDDSAHGEDDLLLGIGEEESGKIYTRAERVQDG